MNDFVLSSFALQNASSHRTDLESPLELLFSVHGVELYVCVGSLPRFPILISPDSFQVTFCFLLELPDIFLYRLNPVFHNFVLCRRLRSLTLNESGNHDVLSLVQQFLMDEEFCHVFLILHVSVVIQSKIDIEDVVLVSVRLISVMIGIVLLILFSEYVFSPSPNDWYHVFCSFLVRH